MRALPPPVRRALAHLTERAALRAENQQLRAELDTARADARALRLQLRLTRYVPRPDLPPLRVTAVRIPTQRSTPEGVPRAARPRSSRRRP